MKKLIKDLKAGDVLVSNDEHFKKYFGVVLEMYPNTDGVSFLMTLYSAFYNKRLSVTVDGTSNAEVFFPSKLHNRILQLLAKNSSPMF